MKTKIIPVIISAFFMSFYSCQEVYINEDLDAKDNIPVVEGMINSGSGPHEILLYNARSYYSSAKTNITGAIVYVKDDIGNAYYFNEYVTGVYRSDPEHFNGTIGRTYTLYIEMPDGRILKSDPEKLRDTLSIGKIIKRRESREEYYRNIDNKIITRTVTGQSNYAVINNYSNEKAFYRIVSYYMVYSTITTNGPPVYKWVEVNGISYEFAIQSDTTTKCVTSFSDKTLPKIGKIDPGENIPEESRMEFSYFILSRDQYYINPLTVWVDESLYTYIFTISREAYDYYEALTEQLNATSRLYDPLPTQLTGNMHCITDSSQVVLGFFEASSYSVNKTKEFPYALGCIDSVSTTITPVL
jgi:Domain of unknown function (DUF4249)